MKNSLTFLLVLFTFSGLFGQTDCTVKIVYSINKSLPPSYTFSTDPKSEGAKYAWSFGDQTYSDSPSPTHTYKLTDSYAVAVKVTSTDGKVCIGELKERFEGGTVTTTTVCKIPITIAKSSTTPPNYTFKTDPQPEGSKYYWHFGDGGISELASPVHTYKVTNTYVVNLKVLDNAGKVCYGEIKETFVGETTLECKAYFTDTNKLWSDPAMMKKMVFSNLSTGDIRECL
jgi:PKD repeat protein